jgi:putative inorganic carbon (hco3(-)) transporter
MTQQAAPPRRDRLSPRYREAVAVGGVLLAAAVAGPALVAAPVLGLAAGGAVVLTAFATRRPDLATMLVLALLYSNAPAVATRHHGIPGLVGSALPVLLLAPLVYHVWVRGRPLRLGIAGPWMVLLAVAHVVAALNSDDWYTGAGATIGYLTGGLALYLLLVNVLRTDHVVRRAALVLVVTAGALGAAALIHTFLDDWPGIRLFGFSELVRGDLLADVDWDQFFSADYPDAELRAAGPIGETNFFAAVLAMAAPYAVAFLVAPRDRLERMAALAAGPFLVTGIVLTYSRGAALVIGLVAAGLAVTGLVPRRSLFALAAAGVALVVAVPDFALRMVRLVTASQLWSASPTDLGDAAVTGRYSEMLAAAHAWADHPFLGVGPGMFPANYLRYSRELGFTVHDGPREAHNLYLEFAAELGTLGLVLIVALFAALLRHLLAVRREVTDRADRAFTVAAIAVVAVIAGNGMLLHLAFERYLWLHVALISAWCAVHRHGAAPAEEPTDTGELEPVGADR